MKKLMLGVIAAVITLGVGLVPQRVIWGLERYNVVTAQAYSYRPRLECVGTTYASEGVRLMANSNLIITELWVQDGGWVDAGQTIALTETPKSEQVILSQPIDIENSSFSPTELGNLAAQYGFALPEDAAAALSESKSDVAAQEVAASTPAVSPISGIISWESSATGQFIPAGSQLCTVLNTGSYRAVVQLPAEQAQLVQPGMEVLVTGSQIDNQSFSGTVQSVGNTVTRSVDSLGYSSCVEAELLLDAPAGAIRHGAAVNCIIYLDDTQVLLTLPYEAVRQDESNREYVYCAAEGTLRKQYIETGRELDDCVEVTAGIDSQSSVIVGAVKYPATNFILEREPN